MSVGCSDTSSSKTQQGSASSDTAAAEQASQAVVTAAESSVDTTVDGAASAAADSEGSPASGASAPVQPAQAVEAAESDEETSESDGNPTFVAADWPLDIPLPKWLEGKPVVSGADSVGLRASGEADYLQNVAFFREQMQASGWTLESEEQPTPIMDSLRFAKDERVVAVVVVAVAGGINVQVSQQRMPLE